MIMARKNLYRKVTTLKGSDLPAFLRVFWDIAPIRFRVSVVIIAAAIFSALLPRLKFKDVFQPHAFHLVLLHVLLIMPPSSGKSFIRFLFKRIAYPLSELDRAERDRLQEWKEKKVSAGSKAIEKRPQTVLRVLQSFTRAAVLRLAVTAERRFGCPVPFLCFTEELRTFADSNKREQGALKTISCIAFDPGATYTSDTSWEGGCDGEADICWSSVMACTPEVERHFNGEDSLLAGETSRQILLSFDDQIGQEPPVFQSMSQEQNELVDAEIMRAMDASYSPDRQSLQPEIWLDMSFLDNDIRSWCEAQRCEVLLSGSRARSMMYPRSSVNAVRICSLLMWMWSAPGVKESRESIERKVRRCYYFFADFCLQSMLERHGQRYEQLKNKFSSETGQCKTTLFDSLPNEFSLAQMQEAMLKLGLKSPANVMLSQYKRKRFVHHDKERDLYIKNF